MPADTSTTRWRDQRSVPTDYEDVAAPVKLARRARGQVVDFDWTFCGDDLEHMRDLQRRIETRVNAAECRHSVKKDVK